MNKPTPAIRQLDVVVGGQYGSEGKGAVAGALVDRYKYDNLIRVAGHNAGHTTLDKTGRAFALRSIPAACVRDWDAKLFIGPGSEVEIAVLQSEIQTLEAAGIPVRGRLFVHNEATVITERHHELENTGNHGSHGSTKKGVGAARAERAMRRAPLVGQMEDSFHAIGAEIYGDEVRFTGRSMIEGTQGYWLGLHAGLYPHCTSSDCRAVDFVAMSGITDWDWISTYVLFRTYPIRIAGPSGGLRNEIAWTDLTKATDGYVQPEITTVTKVIRRVGESDSTLVRPALRANTMGTWSRVLPVLTFADYWEPKLANLNFEDYSLAQLPSIVQRRMVELFGDRMRDVAYAGTGRDTGIWFEGSEDA